MPSDTIPKSGERHDEFMRLFVRHVNEIQGYVRTLLPNAADAEDVLQETSLMLWRKFDEYRPDGNFPAWACRIAFNQVRNFRRVSQRRQTHLLSDEMLERMGDERLASGALLESRRLALEDCLAKLSNGDRGLIDRCYHSSESVKQLAVESGCSAKSIYNRLSQLRQRLFDCISRSLSAEGSRA